MTTNTRDTIVYMKDGGRPGECECWFPVAKGDFGAAPFYHGDLVTRMREALVRARKCADNDWDCGLENEIDAILTHF